MVKYYRTAILLLLDMALVPISAFASYAIRLETLQIPRYFYQGLVDYIVLALLVRTIVFYVMGVYYIDWVHADAKDLFRLIFANSISSAILGVVVVLLLLPFADINSFPRSVIFIDYIFYLALIGASRLALRVLTLARIASQRFKRGPRTRVLIAGAGDAGSLIVRELANNPQTGLDVVGFVDDDPAKIGTRIRGFKVLGPTSDIPHFADKYDVSQVLVAMPTAPGSVVRHIRDVCRERNISMRTIPGLYEILSGEVRISQIRDVQIEDLLRREVVASNPESVAEFLHQKRVAVTGAGGSIGSELCRQVAAARPGLLLLMGHGENSIFQLEQGLKSEFPNVPVVPVIVDIRDKSRLVWAFNRYKPEVVFHAAAHKHVPLMENNVVEAITNNVIATRNLVSAAAETGIDSLVMISTDKAVEPVSIMGASKSLAEHIVTQTASRPHRCYTVVRFGNVLGSRGSVVRTFQEQIRAGGPITITDPHMTRYFMSIPEAVHLVLQALAIGVDRDILVLDMGEPIKVLDIAHDLITLSGLTPYEDIDIVFTGSRPGEKISEHLWAPDEEVLPTDHEKIMRIKTHRPPIENLDEVIDRLDQLAAEHREGEIRAILQEVVPGCQLERRNHR